MRQENLFKNKKSHVAIMRKSWGFIEKILSGKKIIESRWYQHKNQPWDNINKNDDVYFKNSGCPITIKAQVEDVLQFENLNPEKVQRLLIKYYRDDGIESCDLDKYYKLFKNKNYCLLIFLKEVQKISPFEINKSGFGTMTAWITVNDIDSIKMPA